MGEQAEDSLLDDEFRYQLSKAKSKATNFYTVSIVCRKTEQEFWTTTMEASSPKDCQTIFRRDYPEVRAKFNHDYALKVKNC